MQQSTSTLTDVSTGRRDCMQHLDVAEDEVPVQLAGRGTWAQAGELVNSPTTEGTAAAGLARKSAHLPVLLTSKQDDGVSVAPLSSAPTASGHEATGQSAWSPQNKLGAQHAAGKPRTPQLTLQQLLSSPEDVQAAALQQLSLGNIGLPAAPRAAFHAAGSAATDTAGLAGAEAGDAGTWGRVGYASEWLQPASAQQAGLISQHHRDTPDAAWAPERPIPGVAGSRSARQYAPANLQHSRQQGSNHVSTAAAAAGGAASVNQSNKVQKSVEGDAPGSNSPSPAAQTSAHQGTAAFKGSSRAQASLAGRFSTAHQADLPGPGQFRPLHTVLDKHVHTVSFAPKRSKAPPHKHPAGAAAAEDRSQAGPSVSQLPHQARQQQQQQQARLPQDAAASSGGGRVSTGYRDSIGDAVAGRRSSMCTVGSTPRSAAAADEDVARAGNGQQQKQQQEAGKQRQQAGGTAAFKTISRDRAAVGAARAAGVGSASTSTGCDQQQQQQQDEQQDRTPSHTWSRSRGQDFTKQTSRPSPSVPTSSPAALGPGAYFRSGLPVSFTGRGLLAGHHPAAAAPDFSKACSRPSSRGPAHPPHGQPADDPGMWDWAAGAADVTGCGCGPHACGVGAGGQAGDVIAALQEVQSSRPVSGVARTRPRSAALDYVRGQRGAVLVAPPAQDDSWLVAPDSTQQDACSTQALHHQQQQHQQQQCQHQQQQQQQRPATVGPGQQAAGRQYRASLRPASAGLLQTCPNARSPSRPTSSTRAATSGDSGGSRQRPQSMQQCARSPHAAHLRPATVGCHAATSSTKQQQHLGRAEYSTEGDAGLPVSALQRYSSTGLAALACRAASSRRVAGTVQQVVGQQQARLLSCCMSLGLRCRAICTGHPAGPCLKTRLRPAGSGQSWQHEPCCSELHSQGLLHTSLARTVAVASVWDS